MPTPSFPNSRLAALSRLCAWAAALGGATAAAAAGWHAMLLVVAVSLGGCAPSPVSVERPASVEQWVTRVAAGEAAP